MEVLYVRREPTADASLAAIFERSKFGIAIAAMIRMMATTISNSINEKPFCCFFICIFKLSSDKVVLESSNFCVLWFLVSFDFAYASVVVHPLCTITRMEG